MKRFLSLDKKFYVENKNHYSDDELMDLIKSKPYTYLSIGFIDTIKNPSKNFILKFFNEFYKINDSRLFILLFSRLISYYDIDNIKNFMFIFNLIKKFLYDDVRINPRYFCPSTIPHKIVNSKPFKDSKIVKKIDDLFRDVLVNNDGFENPQSYSWLPDDMKTEKTWAAFIKKNIRSITYNEYPSIDLQLYAVKQNINAIFYIGNPDPEVAFYCIISNPELLKIKDVIDEYFQRLPWNYFRDLPLEVQKMLVEYDIRFKLLIYNLHPDLKDELDNIKKVGLF